MKISEFDLIAELELMQADAQEEIRENHRQKMDQNSYGMGWEAGCRDTCSKILDLIKKGVIE